MPLVCWPHSIGRFFLQPTKEQGTEGGKSKGKALLLALQDKFSLVGFLFLYVLCFRDEQSKGARARGWPCFFAALHFGLPTTRAKGQGAHLDAIVPCNRILWRILSPGGSSRNL